MNVKRGTLAVVCLATAVLMLDIAVVNTALPHVAKDLNAGLVGVQCWVKVRQKSAASRLD